MLLRFQFVQNNMALYESFRIWIEEEMIASLGLKQTYRTFCGG